MMGNHRMVKKTENTGKTSQIKVPAQKFRLEQGYLRGLLIPDDGSPGRGHFLPHGEYQYTIGHHPYKDELSCYIVTLPGQGTFYIIISSVSSQGVSLQPV